VIRRPWLPLAALLAALGVVLTIWTSIDRRPPEWDYATHLGRALDCYRILSEPGRDRFREIIEASAFYPPVVQCAAGLLYFVFPVVPLTAQFVMLAYLAVELIAVFALGARLWDPAAGLMAAFLLGTAPFVVFSLLNFQLDLPLMAMVALALYALVRTDHFSIRGWSIGFGVAVGLGMVTKPPFAAYVLPPLLWAVWHAFRAPDRRRRLGLLALALVLAGGLAIPWYGPRLLGLPMQIANRSFKQAAESGYPETFTSEALLYYPRVLPTQFGILASLLFAWGAVALRRQRSIRVFLWAGIVPFALFSLIQNKNLRYTLPILPAAALVATAGWRALDLRWRRGLTWVCVGLGLAQVSMVAFLIPAPPQIPGLSLPMVFGLPPSRADWQHARILADLERLSGGAPATVSVVPNHNFFSVSNFRYEAAVRRLPLQMTRPWSDAPLGVDFVILKTGSQGPSFSVAKAERITSAFDGGDPYLAEIFPVVSEYALPDGSRGILRRRRIEPLPETSGPALARRLRGSPEQLIGAYLRDPVGLRVQLDYRPQALVRGEVDRISIEADSAVVGELKRKDRAPLRVRETRLEVEGLVFNPRRLLEMGQLEVLDVRALRIKHLVVTEDDLHDFLRGQPPGGVAVRLADGAADVQVSGLGPRISARVGLHASATGSPFALTAERVKLGPLPVPASLTNWIVRQFDPSPALRRLPIPVVLSPIAIRPGRLEIGP
jgi:hypothetical protein